MTLIQRLCLLIIFFKLCIVIGSDHETFSDEVIADFKVLVKYKSINSNNLEKSVNCDDSHSDNLVFEILSDDANKTCAILTYASNCANKTFKSDTIVNHTVVALTHIAQEKTLYYFDAANNLFSYQIEKGVLVKIAEAESFVISMTVDWITRTVFWAETEENFNIIYSMDLKNNQLIRKQVYKTIKTINSLVYSPFDRKLLWMEKEKFEMTSRIYFWDLQYNNINAYYLSVCKDTFGSSSLSSLMFTTSAIKFSTITGDQHSTLTYVDESNGNFIAEKLETGECFNFGSKWATLKLENNSTSLHKFYHLKKQSQDQQNVSYIPIVFKVPENSKMFPFDQQIFSETQCMEPEQSDVYLKLMKATSTSLVVKLPAVITSVQSVAKKYKAQCTAVDDETFAYVKTVNLYRHRFTFKNLKPYTNYSIKVAVITTSSNSTELDFCWSGAYFTTKSIEPSEPRDLKVAPLRFNKLLITWLEPEFFNAAEVEYEVHYRLSSDDEENSKIKLVEITSKASSGRKSRNYVQEILEVLPNSTYSVFVRAITENEFFTDSEILNAMSLPEPPSIEVIAENPFNFVASWKKPADVKDFVLQVENLQTQETRNATTDTSDGDSTSNITFCIENLEPNAEFAVSLFLIYDDSKETVYWNPKMLFNTPEKPFNLIALISANIIILLVIILCGEFILFI